MGGESRDGNESITSGAIDTELQFSKRENEEDKKEAYERHDEHTLLKLVYWHDFKTHILKNIIELGIILA